MNTIIDCIQMRLGDSREEYVKADWLMTDFPYGIGASSPSKKNSRVLQKNGSYLPVKQNDYGDNHWDNTTPTEASIRWAMAGCKKHFFWGVNYLPGSYPGGRLVWDKLNGLNDQFDAEIAYVSTSVRVDTVYYRWQGMIQGKVASRNVVEAIKQRGNKALNDERVHPTQKPLLLNLWLLDNYVKPGESVYDPYAGSFSMGLACHIRGIDYIGYEKDPDYYKKGVEWVKSVIEKYGKEWR